jgi:CRISPR-associated protein Csb2
LDCSHQIKHFDMPNLKVAIARWRELRKKEKHRRVILAIPRKVTRSMAFKGEPVSVEMLEAQLEKNYPKFFTTVPGATVARFALIGPPLPRVEETLRIGEWFRQVVMSVAGNILGRTKIPPVLSGHDLPSDNRHSHAFYLPEDSNDDGHIDRVTAYLPGGIGQDCHRVLVRLTRLWNANGGNWRLVLEHIGGIGECQMSPLFGAGTVWVSRTPYLHPWHTKKNFGVEDQIHRECRERGLPAVASLDRLPAIRVNGRRLCPTHFHRFRNKRDQPQPDTHGSFWRIEFAEPVQGPLALGFGCHFGLGIFAAL